MNYQGSSFLIYGHRGASGLLPENTLESFQLALEQGAEAIETDLRRTLDGQFVLAHDRSGKRMCGQSRNLSSVGTDELKRWDAGRGFAGALSRQEAFRIPLLTEALGAFPETKFNIDLKDEDIEPFLPQLLEQLNAVGASKRVLLTSFRSRTLRAIKRLGYPGEIGVGASQVVALKVTPEFILRRLSALWPFGARIQVPISAAGLRLDSASFIAKCHRLGLKVDYWVVNEPEQAHRLVRLGADGIISDYPGTIRDYFRKFI